MTKANMMTRARILFLSLFFLATFALTANADERFVTFTSSASSDADAVSLLAKEGETFSIFVSDSDNSAVRIAANSLAEDFGRVLGAKVSVSGKADGARVIIGTIGQSPAIDRLVADGLIDGKELKGKTEKHLILYIKDKDALVIAGSDRRGTVYGIYELSRQMGVSPWYYWMDVPTERQRAIYIKPGVYTDGEPSVRYRGLFLNDEAPCLTTWVKNTFGTDYGDHNFYAKVFELILRLRGNYLWPAMWGWAFYADDPLNSKTADEMGIIMGTSHHEPMARNHQEWARKRGEYGKWNYQTNQKVLDKFFTEGIERMKGTEDIVTIGMRGDGDEAMSEDADTKLLQRIVKNQRDIIKKVTGKPADKTPQLWALYKEVQDYYDKGMRVPDDVIMLLCDDNWGNVRRVPNAKERKHKGGWGLYYHVDYVGAPRNSKLLNVTPVENMWEQLSLAYNNGIDRLWILNVGDLKPMEYPIQVFMDMAWECSTINKEQFDNSLGIRFCQQTFGEARAEECVRLLNKVCKLNGRCTPEMLDARTYNLETGEWERVIDEYKTLEIEALRLYTKLPAEYRDAYFQSILFPVQLVGNLHQMYHAQAMNLALAAKGDAAANVWADRCEEYFKRDAELMRQYNKDIAGGKWDGMMIQKHIGYTQWNDTFPKDMLPKLNRVENVQNIFSPTIDPATGKGYIAIEAEHFFAKADATAKDGAVAARWTVIPDMGRTLSAVTLMPQTADVTGASLTYKFESASVAAGKAKILVVVKSTLDYLNKGGLTYNVSLDGGESATVNFNSDLNEDPKNIYSVYYPTVARRVVEKTVELPLADGKEHTLTFQPNDPGIVLEKIVIDLGGYKPQYLFGEESPRR